MNGFCTKRDLALARAVEHDDVLGVPGHEDDGAGRASSSAARSASSWPVMPGITTSVTSTSTGSQSASASSPLAASRTS